MIMRNRFTMRAWWRRISKPTAAAGATAGIALAAPATAQAAPVPVFYHYGYTSPSMRPSLIAWGAGGDLFVKGLRWDHWTLTSAYGRGTRWRNTCTPTCSAGNYIKSPASITLWRWRWHSGHRYWTRLTLRWTSRDGVRHKHI
jgi:hypothetical protein